MSNNRFRKNKEKAFLKWQNLNISRNKLYIRNLQITVFKVIYNMFMFYEFDIFRTPENGLNFDLFVNLAHKIAKSKYFVDIQNESNSQINSFTMIYSLLWSVLSFKNYRWWWCGGGHPSISYSAGFCCIHAKLLCEFQSNKI